jgi:hypothetical protein
MLRPMRKSSNEHIWTSKNVLTLCSWHLLGARRIAELEGLTQYSQFDSRKLKIVQGECLIGHQEDRMMTTGKHTVADIFCNCCQRIVGWKYVFSPPRSIFPQIFFISAAVPS